MARRSATVAALAERWAASAERAKALEPPRGGYPRSLPAALGGGGGRGQRAARAARDVLGEAVGAHRAHVPLQAARAARRRDAGPQLGAPARGGAMGNARARARARARALSDDVCA